MLKIYHYRKQCIGCNYCVEVAPAYYQIDDLDAKVNLLDSERRGNYFFLLLPDTERIIFQEAAELCPTDVIRIEKTK